MNFDFEAAMKEAPTEQPAPVRAPPAAKDPFDLAPVKAGLAAYDKQIDAMVQQATALEVGDDPAQVMAVEMAGQSKRLCNAIEKIRKDYVEPHNAFVKSVNGLAKSFQCKLTEIESGLKRKISVYQQRLELERRKQEEAARRAAAEAQRKMDAEAKAAGVETVTIDAPVIPPADPVIRTAAGSAYQERFWSFEVQDEAQIPREYLMVDERKLRDAVKAGVRTIPGVRIWEDSRTKIRT
jgi:hypothetical protein